MKRLLGFIAIACCVFGAAAPVAAGQPSTKKAEDAAVVAAKAWLALIDGRQYGESWDQAAALFKGAVTRAGWSDQVKAARKPLGTVVSRVVDSTKYLTAVPGGPDGEYVVIRFKTGFAHKKDAVETVTPMKDGDGVWRVSGYYIR